MTAIDERPAIRPDWRDYAACRNHPAPDIFFPHTGETARPARTLCRECPVAPDCLEDALATDEQHGIRGGLRPEERRSLQRDRAGTQTPRGRRPTAEQREAAIDLYHRSRHLYRSDHACRRAVAARCEFSVETVRDWLRNTDTAEKPAQAP